MPRVLVIEDEESIRLVLQLSLTLAGFDVTLSATGEGGLSLLAKEPYPDLVLLDLYLSGVSGVDVLAEIRSGSPIPHVPVILMTGAIPDRGVLPPPDTYQGLIGKPFDLDDVTALIRSTLGMAV